jgi:hypothetical protein
MKDNINIKDVIVIGVILFTAFMVAGDAVSFLSL